MNRRRLSLQLTPLLDLLLIVIFAQYMEVQTVSREQTERARSEREAAQTELDSVGIQLAALQKQLDEWEQRRRDTERTDHATREQLGQLVQELFRIPEATIQKISDGRSLDGAVLSEADVAALKAEFKSLSTARADQVVNHLLTFAEMKKRFDVWELHVQQDDSLLITAGTHRHRLQSDRIETPAAFADHFFEVYKTLPQTKSIVLILVSYGDSQLKYRWAVTKGLPAVTERMRLDSNGSIRFEYAVLGFRPDGPTPP